MPVPSSARAHTRDDGGDRRSDADRDVARAHTQEHPPHPEVLPRHLAIIMDGNGRWAEARGVARSDGHRRGAATAVAILDECLARRIRCVTLFAFSVANWTRPVDEVDALMALFVGYAHHVTASFVRKGIRMHLIGDLDRVPATTREALQTTVDLTQHGERMVFTLAVNYGSQRDVAGATREIVREVLAGRLSPDRIDERLIRNHLATRELPDPDLVIRSGGESRLSDFMLLESAHAELYFTPVLWPDFDRGELAEALAEFARRERRFGRTSSQLAASSAPGSRRP
jgi:undecaprenyl diphosphate synthase